MAMRSLEKEKLIIPLQQAIQEYNTTKLLTPELVNKTWKTIWKTWGEYIDEAFYVPPCDRSVGELAQLKKENKSVLLVPDNVDLIMLGKIFTDVQGWAVQEGTTVIDGQNKGGCIDVEMDLDSPHRNTNEDQINEFLKTQERDGQRLKISIIGSRFSRLFFGHYFDETTWSRLPGSRIGNGLVLAGSHLSGRLFVSTGLLPEVSNPKVGFRSEGVKKA